MGLETDTLNFETNIEIIVKNRLIYGGNDTKDLIFNYGP